jgi:hypothetical protein
MIKMPKFTKKEKRNLFYAIMFVGVFLVAAEMQFIPGVPQPSTWLNPQAEFNYLPGTEVYVKITTRVLLGLGTTDLIVNMYDMSGNFMDTCTTSSGVGTFSGMYLVGDSVQLQARQAAPATADPYISPLSEWVVSSAGESADTVVLRSVVDDKAILWLKDAAGAEGATGGTMILRNGWDNQTISDAVNNEFNTTDSAFKATLTLAASNTYFGGDDFVDMITGRQYKGGVFLFWKGTASQSWANTPDYTFSDPSNIYYVWKISDGLYYDANGAMTTRTVTAVISITAAAGSFADDATVIIDICDLLDISQMDTSAMFVDGGATTITAITSAID